ncbi:hypothetical protein MHYP_G00328430 [Metynnis hypsauchen]
MEPSAAELAAAEDSADPDPDPEECGALYLRAASSAPSRAPRAAGIFSAQQKLRLTPAVLLLPPPAFGPRVTLKVSSSRGCTSESEAARAAARGRDAWRGHEHFSRELHQPISSTAWSRSAASLDHTAPHSRRDHTRPPTQGVSSLHRPQNPITMILMNT